MSMPSRRTSVTRKALAYTYTFCALAVFLPACANSKNQQAVVDSPAERRSATASSGTLSRSAGGDINSVQAPASRPLAGPAQPVAPGASVTAPVAAAPSITAGPRPANPAASTDGVWYNSVPVNGPFVALTFDDGPHATNTPILLDMLKQEGVRATFFVVGRNVEAYPAIARRIVAEGHEIASHSYSHPKLSGMSAEGVNSQLKKTHDAIVSVTGVRPRSFRPPYGAFSKLQALDAFQTYGYKTILWDVDPLDWKNRDAGLVTQRIVSGTRSGSIILAHDIHKSTVDAMPATIRQLKAAGYRFVTVNQLIALGNRSRLSAKDAATPAATLASNDAGTQKIGDLVKLAPTQPTVPAAPYQLPSLARTLPVAPAFPQYLVAGVTPVQSTTETAAPVSLTVAQ